MLQVWVRLPPLVLTFFSESYKYCMVKGQAGKGDKYRSVDWKKYSESWESIFGNKKEKKPNERNKSSKNDHRRNPHN